MNTTTEANRYMTSAACAVYIGRSIDCLWQLVRKEQIPVIRVGRRLSFDRERIDRWMDKHAQRGAMV